MVIFIFKSEDAVCEELGIATELWTELSDEVLLMLLTGAALEIFAEEPADALDDVLVDAFAALSPEQAQEQNIVTMLKNKARFFILPS